MALEFSEEARNELAEIKKRYPSAEGAILPCLYLAQREFGYISLEAMQYVAEQIGVAPARIYGVATFYTMFNKEPVGKYLVQVCMNLPCMLRGAGEVFDYISEKLGVKAGETTADGKFTLMKVECLGACGNAPMMQINEDYYEDLTPEKVDRILDGLK
jgi:NADH-quinone oxidoreductase subunit E